MPENNKVIEIKKGDIVKHFEGDDLLEKEIYEVVSVNPEYTGSNDFPEEAVVVYESIFEQGKAFVIEYANFIRELEDIELLKTGEGQTHFVEPLTDEELFLIQAPSFIRAKKEFIKNRQERINNEKTR
ncbi:MAG: hypothetical protein J1F35_01755 [Erysipelotrichales bacterium]|nr:hypothetical protein [Erysipelotrichales bacterium]